MKEKTDIYMECNRRSNIKTVGLVTLPSRKKVAELQARGDGNSRSDLPPEMFHIKKLSSTSKQVTIIIIITFFISGTQLHTKCINRDFKIKIRQFKMTNKIK